MNDILTPFDDQPDLFVPPNRDQPASYGVGVLLEWDPVTFRNVVSYRGATLQNLSVLNGMEALSFTPNIPVSLIGQSGTGVLTSYSILGRFIDPGDSASAEAIQALQTTAARELSAEIFAERIFSVDVLTQEQRNSIDFGDLATVGPTVPDVPITAAGRAVVICSCAMTANPQAGGITSGGIMSFEVTGETSVAPVDNIGYSLSHQSAATGLIFTRASSMSLVDNLNPGLHTFTAKYRAVNIAPAQLPAFSSRNITVISF